MHLAKSKFETTRARARAHRRERSPQSAVDGRDHSSPVAQPFPQDSKLEMHYANSDTGNVGCEAADVRKIHAEGTCSTTAARDCPAHAEG